MPRKPPPRLFDGASVTNSGPLYAWRYSRHSDNADQRVPVHLRDLSLCWSVLYLLCDCRADADVDGCKVIVKNLDIASEAAVTDVECLAVCVDN